MCDCAGPLHLQLLLWLCSQQRPVCIHRPPPAMPAACVILRPPSGANWSDLPPLHHDPDPARPSNQPQPGLRWRQRLPEPHGTTNPSSHRGAPAPFTEHPSESQPVPPHPAEQQSQSLYAIAGGPAASNHHASSSSSSAAAAAVSAAEPLLFGRPTAGVQHATTCVHKGRFRGWSPPESTTHKHNE